MTGAVALYELAADYRDAASKLAELDLNEATIADTLEGMSGDLVVKGTNVMMLAANLDATAKAIKDAEARMAERRRAIENRAARLRAYLLQCMNLAGIKKIESPELRITVRQNPQRVDIFEAALLPPEYLREVPTPPPEPDKKALLADMKAGKEVQGARLVDGDYRLEVR